MAFFGPPHTHRHTHTRGGGYGLEIGFTRRLIPVSPDPDIISGNISAYNRFNPMGVYTEGCRNGRDFRPSVEEMAGILVSWDPMTDDPDSLGRPPPDDFPITPCAATTDTDNRIEMEEHMAETNRAISGFIGSIEQAQSENAEAGFRCEELTKIIATPYGCAQSTDGSWIIHRVRAYASNAMLSGASAIAIGAPVYGVIAAGYNGRGRAILDAWRAASGWAFWINARTRKKFPVGDYGRDDEWFVDWVPVFGGRAFALHAPADNPLYGCRIKPRRWPEYFHS